MERPVYGRLAGRVTLVTGGASGIGAAISRLFAREGAAVAILDLNRAAGHRLASELRDSGSAASFVEANVADSDGIAAAFDEICRRHGRLDVVVNNAGIGSQTSGDEAGWWRLLRINVLGVAWGMREAVRAMRRQGDGGAIVNIGSHAGLRGARAGAYGASKAAVHALSSYTARAHARDLMRVNALLPGNIYTPIHDLRRHQALVRRMDGDPDAFAADPLDSGEERDQARDAMLEELHRIHPLGRLARVEDIAEGALYLASGASEMATGNELMVTGGIAPLRFRPGAAAAWPAVDRRYPDGPTALVTANAAIRESLQTSWERAGLPVTVAPVAAGSRLAGIVFAVSPDRGGDLFSQGPKEWEAELAANLRAPWTLAYLASEVVEPGGAVTLVADAAGATGVGGSPAFCAACAALTYATDDLAEMLRARGIRLNTIIAERTSCTSGCTSGRQGPGGDIAELALAVARATSLAGAQLSLETTQT